MNINFENDYQLTVTFNKQAENILLQQGYDSMNIDDKNSLLVIISNKENIAFSDVDSDYILNYHKTLKITNLSNQCNDAITMGFTSSNGHIYRLNDKDQINMIGQKDELKEDDTIVDVLWKTEDMGYINHTRDEWFLVYKEAFAWKKQQLLKYNDLKTKVINAKIHDDIIKIIW